MESDTADSDTDVSCYSYSVDELYEAVENSSKLVTRQTTVKKTISKPASLNLNVSNELDCNSEININNIEIFEFNELNNDNMKIIPNYENETESVTNHNIIADIIHDDDTNKSSLEHNNNNNIQNNKDINVSVEENDTISQNIGRKRSKKANSEAWSRNDAKCKRIRGEAYLGYRRKEKQSTLNILHDTPREERQMGPPCQSKICKQWKTRFCSEIKCDDRLKIFNHFWKDLVCWKEKQIYILSLIELVEPKQRTTKSLTSRRSGTYFYYLKVGNSKFCVCRNMFLNTFGLKESTIRYWLQRESLSENILPRNVREDLGIVDEEIECVMETENDVSIGHKKGFSRRAKKYKNEYLKQFFNKLPKLPSHYCRKSTRKLYLQTDITSIAHLYNIYCDACKIDNEEPLSRKKFVNVYNDKNLSIFMPKKDQCDKCCEYKVNNVSEEEYQKHIARKNQAREEKNRDKISAESGECHTFTCDLMAVQLLPYCQASALYYKMKLAVHNYTIYNLSTHEAICYWFDESQCDLVASVFASCLVDTIEKTLSTSLKPVIIYTDGCTAQNRNSVLSNALLHLSIKYNIDITQKYLEKGHTQMECDSVHSVIERKMKTTDHYLPSQLFNLATEARRYPFPYKNKLLEFSFFSDYSIKNLMIYDSIRPGKKSFDPVVTDIRVLKYCAKGVILYKINYNDDFTEMPRRPNKIDMQNVCSFPKLYESQKKISLDKWNDLQSLKSIIPFDCHGFYDSLPHMDESVRKLKKTQTKN